MFKQWRITVVLVIAIVVLGVKIVQFSVMHSASPSPSLWFSCAVAVQHQAGELCVRGPSGASVSIEVTYCDGSQVKSPVLRTQIEREYRWIWQVGTSCRGQAKAIARALWSDKRQSEAVAFFEVV
jgi:hypothetical protein